MSSAHFLACQESLEGVLEIGGLVVGLSANSPFARGPSRGDYPNKLWKEVESFF
jgi:hypothetical protein